MFQLSFLGWWLVRELDHDLLIWSGSDVGFYAAELLESPLLEGSAAPGLRPLCFTGHQAGGFTRVILCVINSTFSTIFLFLLPLLLLLDSTIKCSDLPLPTFVIIL